MEKGNKNASPLFLKMMATTGVKGSASGQPIRATLPYIRQNIPIVVVFRALEMVPDREHICYEHDDYPLLEMLKASVEEAFVIQDRGVALDFIGKRGSTVGATRENCGSAFIVTRRYLSTLFSGENG